MLRERSKPACPPSSSPRSGPKAAGQPRRHDRVALDELAVIAEPEEATVAADEMQFGAHLPLMDFGGNAYDGATLRAYAAARGRPRLHDARGERPPGVRRAVARRPDRARVGHRALRADDAGDDCRVAGRARARRVREADRRPRPAVGRTDAGRRRPGLVGARLRRRRSRLRRTLEAPRRSDPHAPQPLGSEREPFVGTYYSTEGIELAPVPGAAGRAADLGRELGFGRRPAPRRAPRRRLAGLGVQHHAAGVRRGLGNACSGCSPSAGHDGATFPNALGTMWFHITDDADEAEAVFRERIVPTVHRPEDVLRERLPVGPADVFAEKLWPSATPACSRSPSGP